jgi:hypothetical protein
MIWCKPPTNPVNPLVLAFRTIFPIPFLQDLLR